MTTFVYYGHISNSFLRKKGKCYDQCKDIEDRRECLEHLKAYRREAFLNARGKSNYQGLNGASRWKERVADIVDFLRLTKLLIRMFLKDIGRYWNPDAKFGSDVRRELTERLSEALCNGDDIMLVSHSLGTMIAYDVLWKFSYYGEYHALRTEGNKLNTLVTLGSPLGNKTVKKNLKGSRASGPRKYPTLIETWENFAASFSLCEI